MKKISPDYTDINPFAILYTFMFPIDSNGQPNTAEVNNLNSFKRHLTEMFSWYIEIGLPHWKN